MTNKNFTEEGMRAVLASTISDDMRADEFIDSETLDALAKAAFKLAEDSREEHGESEYDRGYDAGLDACAWTHE